jgi:chromosome segregation ATPase
MEVLKRVEDKIHALVAHRNQLLGDLGQAKTLLSEREKEIQQLRSDLEGARSKAAALSEEREAVKVQVESILNQIIEQIEAQK